MDDFRKFYEQFGQCLKFGVHENSFYCLKVTKLLRFHSSKSGDEQISFMEYVDRVYGKRLKSIMKKGLDLDDEDEKKMLEELKAEFVPLTELMSAWSQI